MADIFQYINAMYCIRDDIFNPIHDKNVIIASDLTDVNKSIIIKAYDVGNTNALIFHNELFCTRPIGDINNNEIKNFLQTNSTWDVIILSPHSDLSLVQLEGYTHIKLVNSTEFMIDKIYLVSNKFMQKVKNNAISNVETYYYSNTFIDATLSTINNNNKYNVKVGKVLNLNTLETDNIKYTWTNFSI